MEHNVYEALHRQLSHLGNELTPLEMASCLKSVHRRTLEFTDGEYDTSIGQALSSVACFVIHYYLRQKEKAAGEPYLYGKGENRFIRLLFRP